MRLLIVNTRWTEEFNTSYNALYIDINKVLTYTMYKDSMYSLYNYGYKSGQSDPTIFLVLMYTIYSALIQYAFNFFSEKLTQYVLPNIERAMYRRHDN